MRILSKTCYIRLLRVMMEGEEGCVILSDVYLHLKFTMTLYIYMCIFNVSPEDRCLMERTCVPDGCVAVWIFDPCGV